jgi:hypothetical protein
MVVTVLPSPWSSAGTPTNHLPFSNCSCSMRTDTVQTSTEVQNTQSTTTTAHLQLVSIPKVCQDECDCCYRLAQPLVISQDATQQTTHSHFERQRRRAAVHACTPSSLLCSLNKHTCK